MTQRSADLRSADFQSALRAAGFQPALCVLLLLTFVSFSYAASRPNILLISIDTLRADHLGCYGYSKRTPAIDSLAANSALFETAISQAPLTLPSHCTILTGLYPDQHGVRNNENFVLPANVETLAEMFRKNGYSTGAVVGSFSLDSTFGLKQGFDDYEDRVGEGHDPEINRQAERRAQAVWKLARIWLEKQKTPWFSFVHFFDPHEPYMPPPGYAEGYDGEVAYVDKIVGEMLQFLKQKKLDSSTIVILLSDHGESLGEHGESDHGVFLYDATLRVPLMISGPGIKPMRIKQQVRLVDVAPTISALAAVQGGKFAGESLLPMMKGAPVKDLPAYSESYYANLLMAWAPLHSIRWRGKKWIDAPKAELYDLTNDPRETKNLFAASAVAKEMRVELEKHRKATSQQSRAIDPETQEKLASLGYVTGGSSKTIASSFDPKDGILVWEQIKRAVSLAQRGNFAESEAVFEKVLQKQADNVIAHKFMAAVLHKQGKDEEATTHLQTALKSPLHQNDTRCAMAELYYDRKQYAQAQRELQNVLRAEPANLRALRLAASIAMDTKQYEAALKNLDSLLKIDPTDVRALSNRARLFSYLQRDKDALHAYQQLASFRPLEEQEAIQVAAIYLTERNVEAAENYFRQALKANAESARAWQGLGLILAAQQNWAAAFEAFVNAGDCPKAADMLQKQPDVPDKHMEVYRQKCGQ